MNDTSDTKPKQYQCRHIFTDGHRCASPCLRGEAFCYYHHTTRKPVANPQQRRSRRTTFHLPLPEDRSAVQHSIGEIIQRLAANDIDPRRAGLLLYALQIASSNLPKTLAAKASSTPPPTPQTVEEITLDPTHGPLAPPAELNTNPTRRRSFAELLMERLEQDQRLTQEEEAEQTAEQTPEPNILPTLQATQENRHPERSCSRSSRATQPKDPERSTRTQTPHPFHPQPSVDGAKYVAAKTHAQLLVSLNLRPCPNQSF